MYTVAGANVTSHHYLYYKSSNGLDCKCSKCMGILRTVKVPVEVELRFHADRWPSGEYSRRYNFPASNDITILLLNDLHEGIQE